MPYAASAGEIAWLSTSPTQTRRGQRQPEETFQPRRAHLGRPQKAPLGSTAFVVLMAEAAAQDVEMDGRHG